MRLQKYIAEAGLASRREAERWIREGRVAVNGAVVTEMGTKVAPGDRVAVDGRPVSAAAGKATYLFYKPKNVMVTRKDPRGRPTVYDYLKKIPERLFPVGRLDFDSEGLLVLTNDGELAHRLMHPRSKVEKVYQVAVDRLPAAAETERLKKGVVLDGGIARVESIKVHDAAGRVLEVVLTQGKRRQIRRMLADLGIGVMRLKRIQVGPYRLGNLEPGEWRRSA